MGVDSPIRIRIFLSAAIGSGSFVRPSPCEFSTVIEIGTGFAGVIHGRAGNQCSLLKQEDVVGRNYLFKV
jgi:hypothetical protein